MPTWTRLGHLAPETLREARLELHHAAQLPAIAIGRGLVPQRDDDSNTALTWIHDAEQWVSERIPDTGGLRVGLRPRDLTLTVGFFDAPAANAFALGGKTRADGLAWLRGALGPAAGVDPERVRFDFHYEMPSHPIEEGTAFRGDLAASHAELGHWFSNAAILLGERARTAPGASAVLTWPHHFDIGVVLPVDPADAPSSKTVGIGLSAGDEHCEMPYFYVNGRPVPDHPQPPALALGAWQTEGFFGALLTADALLAGDPDHQRDRAESFLESAGAAVREALG